MDKYSILDSINSFLEIKKENESKANKYYYVDSNEAKQKANFIKYLIDNNSIIKDKFNTIKNIFDLSFGSGSLTSHIILDNDINYNRIILNDKYIEDCNIDLKNKLDNCEIKNIDFFNEEKFIENSVDLLIFNPTHGGRPSKKDYTAKENQNFQALNKTIKKILKNNAIVVFRGSEDDFNKLYFSNFKYQQIFIDNDYLFITYDISKIKKDCYEYTDNKFIENKLCKKAIKNNENCSSISDILDDMNTVNSDEQNDGIFNNENKEVEEMEKEVIKKEKFSNEKKGNLVFPYKNILFKGVPGTGKSRAIDTIIEKKLNIKNEKKNILRINIHSASSNSDLMQGIGISTSLNGTIKYSEKQGLILDIIKRATFNPNQPFVLILEEIQENSLNELIGDLIYLIEDDKRAKKIKADNQEYSYKDLVNKLIEEDSGISYIEIPYLVDDSTDYKKMILPNNLFIFCTSNYRDDKKVIEDNLLRRFEVIEIYPKNQEEMGKDEKEEYYFKSKEVSDFLESLNLSILDEMDKQHETHPDRFIIGHSIWKDVIDETTFYKAFSKLITEFKDIREIEFSTFKDIIKNISMPYVEIEIENIKSYFNLIKDIQAKIDYGFID